MKSWFFGLPLELREKIYDDVLDVRVNFIFKSSYNAKVADNVDPKDLDEDPEDPDRRNSLDGEYFRSWGEREEDEDEDDQNEDEGDEEDEEDEYDDCELRAIERNERRDCTCVCPVTYEVSPLPRNLFIVCKQFYEDIRRSYDERLATIARVLDASTVGTKAWTRRFLGSSARPVDKTEEQLKEEASNEEELQTTQAFTHSENLLSLIDRGRFVFDGSTGETLKTMNFLPRDICHRVRCVFLGAGNLFWTDYQTAKAWSKPGDDSDGTKYCDFATRLSETFENLERLAMYNPDKSEDTGFFAKAAPIQAFKMLQRGKIQSLELVYNAYPPFSCYGTFFEIGDLFGQRKGKGEDDEGNFDMWDDLVDKYRFFNAETLEGLDEEEMLARMKKWIEEGKKDLQELKEKHFTARRLTSDELYSRGTLSGWEKTVFRIEPGETCDS